MWVYLSIYLHAYAASPKIQKSISLNHDRHWSDLQGGNGNIQITHLWLIKTMYIQVFLCRRFCIPTPPVGAWLVHAGRGWRVLRFFFAS